MFIIFPKTLQEKIKMSNKALAGLILANNSREKNTDFYMILKTMGCDGLFF